MVSVFVGLTKTSQVRKVVPFVVGDDVAHLKRSTQVRFMIKQGWLRGDNVLAWEEIASFNEVHDS